MDEIHKSFKVEKIFKVPMFLEDMKDSTIDHMATYFEES